MILSGASGFLGGYLRRALAREGLPLVTVGRRSIAPSSPRDRHISCDLGMSAPELALSGAVYAVHNAGLAHRRAHSDAECAAFFEINREGTRRFLAGLDRGQARVCGLVLISTVAVYGLEEGRDIDEDQSPEAEDPYGRSKCEAERLAAEWAGARDVPLCILRLPLVAGTRPPGNLGAMIRAIRRGYYLRIGAGSGRRSWVWAADVAALLPRALGRAGVYHLTDGAHPDFLEIETALRAHLAKPRGLALPGGPARMLAKLGDGLHRLGVHRFPFDGHRLRKMEAHLVFSDARARHELAWQPREVLAHVAQVFGDDE